MVSILLQRRNIIKCIFKQQLPTPALQSPARPPVSLHLIGEECAGRPRAGLKNAEFPCCFRRSQMTLVSYILSLVDHCYSIIKQRNGKVWELTSSFFYHFYSTARKRAREVRRPPSLWPTETRGILGHHLRWVLARRGLAQARNSDTGRSANAWFSVYNLSCDLVEKLWLLGVIYLLKPHREKGGKEEQDELGLRNHVLDGEYNYHSEQAKGTVAFPWVPI